MTQFNVSHADFISTDTVGVRGPRKPDGSLPDINFMHLSKGSDLIDAGTGVGIPYQDLAPDLGAFEYGISTPAGVDDIKSLPEDIYLYQNYPNPLNPSTTIKYEIPRSSRVKIILFDLLGREVKELVNEVKNAGIYKVKFNATSLVSGVYFYKLEAGDLIQVKRMMFLK